MQNKFILLERFSLKNYNILKKKLLAKECLLYKSLYEKCHRVFMFSFYNISRAVLVELMYFFYFLQFILANVAVNEVNEISSALTSITNNLFDN